jgi:hypothetical protein
MPARINRSTLDRAIRIDLLLSRMQSSRPALHQAEIVCRDNLVFPATSGTVIN